MNFMPFINSIFLGVIALFFNLNAISQIPIVNAKASNANLLVGT